MKFKNGPLSLSISVADETPLTGPGSAARLRAGILGESERGGSPSLAAFPSYGKK